MSCPTCDHTMIAVAYAEGRVVWHCPRCGTHKSDDTVIVPALVERCRKFSDVALRSPQYEAVARYWQAVGIAESINTPENRP